jgi:hypothetical protein
MDSIFSRSIPRLRMSLDGDYFAWFFLPYQVSGVVDWRMTPANPRLNQDQEQTSVMSTSLAASLVDFSELLPYELGRVTVEQRPSMKKLRAL